MMLGCLVERRTGYNTVSEMTCTSPQTGAGTLQPCTNQNCADLLCSILRTVNLTHNECYRHCCSLTRKILMEVNLQSPAYVVSHTLIDQCIAVQLSSSGQVMFYLSAIKFSITHTIKQCLAVE